MASEETEQTDEQGEDQPSGKGGKLLLIVGLVLGIALGGGVAAVLLPSGGDEAAEDAEQAEVPDAEAEAETAVPAEVLTVAVTRLPVPLADAQGEVLGYMFVDLSLEVDGMDSQSYVAARVPRLRDAYLRRLSGQQLTLADRPGALDYDRLNLLLMDVTGSVVGADRVTQIFVTQVVHLHN